MVLKMFKKKKAPQALPDLAINSSSLGQGNLYSQAYNNSLPQQPALQTQSSQAQNLSASQFQNQFQNQNQAQSFQPQQEMGREKQDYKQLTEYKNFIPQNTLPSQVFQAAQQKIPEKSQEENLIKQFVSTQDEEGFFKDLMKNITSDLSNIDHIDSLYKKKLQGEDIVQQMRNYWEKQKPELALRNMNNELVTQLKEKTENLHSLEKEWQQIYLSLIEKEEQMREDEKELKKMLAEFIDNYKKKKK